jgi:hypothetical protein
MDMPQLMATLEREAVDGEAELRFCVPSKTRLVLRAIVDESGADPHELISTILIDYALRNGVDMGHLSLTPRELWMARVSGAVDSPRRLTADELKPKPPERQHSVWSAT